MDNTTSGSRRIADCLRLSVIHRVCETNDAHLAQRASGPTRADLQSEPSPDQFASGSVWSVNGGSGGGACNEAAAVLPDDDSFLQAIALTAIASGAVVEVAVDSTLPMLGVYCQVSMLSIKGN